MNHNVSTMTIKNSPSVGTLVGVRVENKTIEEVYVTLEHEGQKLPSLMDLSKSPRNHKKRSPNRPTEQSKPKGPSQVGRLIGKYQTERASGSLSSPLEDFANH